MSRFRLRSLLSCRNKNHSPALRQTRQQRKLKLELLESRNLLATFSWNVDADGNWNDAANWSLVSGALGVGYPNAVDDVAQFPAVITANRVVTIPTGVNVKAGTVSFDETNASYQIAGLGTLTLDVTSGNAAISLAGTNSVSHTISAKVSLSDTAQVTNNSSSVVNAIIISGAVSGAGGVIKAGTQPLTLSGGNSYGGSTTINAGQLSVFGGSAIPDSSAVTLANASGASLDLQANESIGTLAGGGASGGDISLNANTLTTNIATPATYAGVVSGTGGLTKLGSSSLTLSGANLYAGTTTVSGGTLLLGNPSALGSTAGATTIASGATVNLNGQSLSEPFNLNGQGVSTSGALINDSGTASTVSGTVALQTDASVGGTGTITFGAAIGESGGARSFTKTGTGQVNLNAANTYTGITTVQQGTLAYGINNAIASGPVTVTGSAAILALGSFTDTVGTVTVESGGRITGTGTLTSTGTFEMRDGTVNAILAGSGIPLNKTTSGTVTLTGASTYTGTTTVSAGRLLVNGSLDSAANVATASGVAILGGTGTVNGVVSIGNGGRVDPATALAGGVLTVNNNYLVSGTGAQFVDLNSASSFDQVRVTGASSTVTLSGTLSVNVNYPVNRGTKFKVIDNQSGNAVSGTFARLPEGATIVVADTYGFQVSYVGGDGNDVELTTVPVVTISLSPTSIAEDSLGQMTYRFYRTLDTLLTQVVNFSVSGTATYLSDYTVSSYATFDGVSGTVTIPAGQNSIPLFVTALNDTLVETDETVTIAVTPNAGYALISASTKTGTITDITDTASLSIAKISTLPPSQARTANSA